MDNLDYEIISEINDEFIIREYEELVYKVMEDLYSRLIIKNPSFRVCFN